VRVIKGRSVKESRGKKTPKLGFQSEKSRMCGSSGLRQGPKSPRQRELRHWSAYREGDRWGPEAKKGGLKRQLTSKTRTAENINSLWVIERFVTSTLNLGGLVHGALQTDRRGG